MKKHNIVVAALQETKMTPRSNVSIPGADGLGLSSLGNIRLCTVFRSLEDFPTGFTQCEDRGCIVLNGLVGNDQRFFILTPCAPC